MVLKFMICALFIFFNIRKCNLKYMLFVQFLRFLRHFNFFLFSMFRLTSGDFNVLFSMFRLRTGDFLFSMFRLRTGDFLFFMFRLRTGDFNVRIPKLPHLLKMLLIWFCWDVCQMELFHKTWTTNLYNYI